MKILVINTKPDLSFFTKRGLVLDVTYDTCDKIFPTIKTQTATTSDNKTISLYSPDVYDYLNKTYKEKYDVVIFGWNPKDYSSEYNSTGGQTFRKKLDNGAYYITVRQGGNYEVHELMHAIGQILYLDLKKYDAVDQMDVTFINQKPNFYYLNDQPENPDSNHGRTWDTYKKYLPELNNLNKMAYKYFKNKEIAGLKPELVEKLDKARGIAGVPFIIESGFRTPEHNKEVGGVENSAHTKGLAVDLRCNNSVNRFKIVSALLNVGFKRIGISYKRNFIHADIDTSLPQEVIWGYDN